MSISDEDKEKRVSRKLTDITASDGLPRERALKHGLRSLSNAEIIAILLGSGIAGKNVMDIAHEIANNNEGHLSTLLSMTPKEVSRTFNGVGPNKALTLLAAMELGRRTAEDAAELQLSAKAVSGSASSYELMRHRFTGLKHEEFWVLALNNALKRITDFRVNEGTATTTLVDVRKIIIGLLESGASSAILLHNHPSGSKRPSKPDDALTRKIVDAAKLFDIRVIDHLIITESGYYSYADEGRL